MTRHHTRRQPKKKTRGFSWGRFPIESGGAVTGVEWRLFRRDHRGAVHFECRLYLVDTPRKDIAPFLLRVRHVLRDRVDEIDLAAMEEAA